MNKQIKELQNQLAALREKFDDVDQAHAMLKQQFTKLNTLYAISSILGKIHNLEQLLNVAKNTILKDIQVDRYSLFLIEEDSHELALRSSHGFTPESTPSLNTNSLFKRAIQRKKSVYISDLSKRNDDSNRIPGIRPSGSSLCVPLVCETNEVLGVMHLYRTRSHFFESEEIEYINKIAHQIANSLHKIQIFEYTKKLSIRDELTELFNRRYFNQCYERELQRAKRYQRSLAIVMLDIDHFKNYNDLNGHLMGDTVLKEVAFNLEKILRKADLVARFGGEEFIIMLPEISKEQALKVANKLRRQIEKTVFPNEASQPNGKITVSLGLAVYPVDSEDPQKLIQDADDALYMAKTLGRNCVAWHGMKAPKSTKAKGPPQSKAAKLAGGRV